MSVNANQPTLAIIGAGHMGASLCKGLIQAKYPGDKIFLSNPALPKLTALQQHYPKIHITTDNLEAAATAKVIIFAVKPVVIATVAKELAPVIQRTKPLIISVATGITIQRLQNYVGPNIAIIRSMPNLPAAIGAGVTALYANRHTNAEQRSLATHIMQSMGLAVWLEDENLLAAVTAISGSGPAYFFLIMEYLAKAGERLGLPVDVARTLTISTALGAARMADLHPDVRELRLQVTSPGGTTEKAIQAFEQAGLDEIVMRAAEAARDRAEELSNM